MINQRQLFQAQYKLDFNGFDAMPISDLFIAKRIQNSTVQWKLFDAYKFNRGYNVEITENGRIETMGGEDDEWHVVGANFSTARRQNLKGINVTCGLVVKFKILELVMSSVIQSLFIFGIFFLF